VAIFHCQTKPLSRSGGRSAVAASAYRAGVKLKDERTGIVHDFTRRSGVESADLLLPEGAPDLDRGEIWNQAERAEARKDARTAREWVTALPAELGSEERRALALEFGRALVERYGVAVDVAIHAPGRRGDDRNHHAHLLTTTRKVGPEGLSEKADIELSDKARIARGLTPARKEIEAVRALWAGLANEHLERAGRVERVDHRSLAAQGIEREPTKHLGPAATAIERATQAPSRLREDRQAAAAFGQTRAEELDTEVKAIRAELADLLKHRADLERQQVGRETRQQEIREQVAAIRAGLDQAKTPEAPATAAPAVDAPAQPKEKETAGQRFEREALELIASGPPGTAERLYEKAIGQLEAQRHAKAQATLEALRIEREALTQARQAHQATKPWTPIGRGKWEAAGVALEQSGRDLSKRETAAAKAIEPKTIQAAAEAAAVKAIPRVVELATSERQARLEREAAEAAAKEAAAKEAIQNALLARDFDSIAGSRERKMTGYRDNSDDWKATPPRLREIVDDYLTLPKDRRETTLKSMVADPNARDEIRGLIKERKQTLSKQRSR